MLYELFHELAFICKQECINSSLLPILVQSMDIVTERLIEKNKCVFIGEVGVDQKVD